MYHFLHLGPVVPGPVTPFVISLVSSNTDIFFVTFTKIFFFNFDQKKTFSFTLRFWAKFQILLKILMFVQKLNSWANFQYFSKKYFLGISICGKNLDFYPKTKFLGKIIFFLSSYIFCNVYENIFF